MCRWSTCHRDDSLQDLIKSNLLLCRHNISVQCANLTKIVIIRTGEGHSRSVIQSCGCDQEGRKPSWETGIKEVGFEVFPEICDRGAIFFLGRGKSSKEPKHSD